MKTTIMQKASKVITLEAKTSSVKIFVGKNFRHLPKISSLFTDENFNLVF